MIIDHSVHHNSDDNSSVDTDHFCSLCIFSIQSYDVEHEVQTALDVEKSKSQICNVTLLQSIQLIEEKGRAPPIHC